MIIWLASYPRSGNTFLRTILNSCFNIKTYSVYNDLHDIGADQKTSEIVGHVFLEKDYSEEELRKSEKRYFIKTHGLWKEEYKKDKVIYLIRDGRESTVSYIRYSEKFQGKGNIDPKTIIGNDLFVGDWGDHVRSWIPDNKDREHILVIKFEDLISEPELFLEPIQDFCGLKIVSNNIPSFQKLNEVNRDFFRSGKTDSWKETLTEDVRLYFLLKNGEILEKFNYPPDPDKTINDTKWSLKEKLVIDLIDLHRKELDKKIEGFKQTIHQQTQTIHQQNNKIQKLLSKIDHVKSSMSYQLGFSLTYPFRMIRRMIVRKTL